VTVAGEQKVTLTLPDPLLSLSVKVDPLSVNQVGPNRWTIPALELPNLLRGQGVQEATAIRVDKTGLISLATEATVSSIVSLSINPGDLVVNTLKTPPSKDQGNPDRNNYDILMDSQGTFRAIGTIPTFSSTTSTRIQSTNLIGLTKTGNEIPLESYIPTSIRTIGKIVIRHNGESFTEAIGFKNDKKGMVLVGDVSGYNVSRRVVFDGRNSSGVVRVKFENGDFFDEIDNFNKNTTPVIRGIGLGFNPQNIEINKSYTVGLIFIQNNNGNGSLLGSLQDSILPNKTDITILSSTRSNLENPIIKDPIIKDPVIKDPVINNPIVKDPTVVNPVTPTIPIESITVNNSNFCSNETLSIVSTDRGNSAGLAPQLDSLKGCKSRSVPPKLESIEPMLKIEPDINKNFNKIPQIPF
jgi:hypothetical protein